MSGFLKAVLKTDSSVFLIASFFLFLFIHLLIHLLFRFRYDSSLYLAGNVEKTDLKVIFR